MMSKLPFEQGDEQFSLEMQQVSDIYQQLSLDLFLNIVRRLKQRGTADLIREPYVWQLEKLNDLHLLTEENVKLIAARAEVAEDILRNVIANEGYQVYKDTHGQLQNDTGQDIEPRKYHVQKALESYANQTMFELDNLINTTLPASVQNVYKSVIEEAVASVVAGTKSADKALNDTLMRWADKGFYGFTDKAGRSWRAEAYARSVIKSTTYRVYRDIRERPAEEFGIDTFYYSTKASARAMCSPLQHQIVTKGAAREEEGVQILSLLDYGYGTAGGCLGINCGHYLTPFIPGVNQMPDLPEHLQNITPKQAEENARAEAQQRAIEREIRKNKERLKIARELKDNDLVQKYKLKDITLNGQLKTHLDNHKFLSRNVGREKLDRNPKRYAKEKLKLERKANEFHYVKQEDVPKFKKSGGNITAKERKVVYADQNPQGLGYIGTPHSFAINKYLRDNNPMPAEYRKIVNTLDGVIKKNTLLKNTKVNRFDDKEYFESILRQNAKILKKYGSIEAALNSGEATFYNDAFTSTSYIPKYNFFKDRPIKTIINISKNHKIYFTDNDAESEIIIPRGAKYDIINMKRKGNNVIVEMNLREE